jgi:signal transduction histidine kinase
MALSSLYFPPRALHAAGLTFTILFPLLFLFKTPAPGHLYSDLAEISAFFFCTLAVGFISRRILQERFRYENAIASFHSLSQALTHKNMNLQTALDALSEAHTKLQEFDKTKTNFLSNVSHELRTPLSSIRSYSEILLNYDDIEPETQREFLQSTLEEAGEVGDMADDMIAAWKAGDVRALDADLLGSVREQPEVYRTLIVRRNEHFANAIGDLVNGRKNYLIVVGALHLVGPDSVLRMLERQGVASRQIGGGAD